MSNTLGFGLDVNRGGAGYKYQSETVTLLRALTGTYSTPRKIQIDKLIKSLKTAGVWAKLDVLQIYAAPNAADAVVNWKTPGTFNATLVNSPTLEVDRGITGDGVSSCINTGYVPSTANGNLTLNSAMFGIYFRVNNDSATLKQSGAGLSADSNIRLMISKPHTGLADYRVYVNSIIESASSTERLNGMFVATRTANNVQKLIVNNTVKINGTAASSALPDNSVHILARKISASPNSFGNDQVSIGVLGAGLSDVEVVALTNTIETYLDSIGAGVIT